MNWQDEDLEAFLRQFQLRKPPALASVHSPTRVLSRSGLAAAAAIVLAVVIPLALLWRAPADERKTSAAKAPAAATTATAGRNTNSPVSAALPTASARLLPYVEMTLYASAPLPLAGPHARVDMSLPGAPSRKTLTRVRPDYPPEAQRLGLEASLDLRLRVNAAGDVVVTERLTGGTSVHHDDDNAAERAEFLAAHPNIFWGAAEAAARKWKFEPARGGMTCVVSFAFRLKPDTTVSSSTTGSPARSSRPSAVGVPLPGPAQPAGPIRVGGNVKPPHAIVKMDPIYPDDAQAAHVAGVVLLEIMIGADGSVLNARVLRSIPMLDQAAVDAVRQWKYEPTLLNAVPVEVEMNVFINFTLSK
jgi:TonB family protein